MRKYKLTTQDMKTRKGYDNETTWTVGKFQPELSGKGDLCNTGWYHYYHDPLLAAMMNPAHAEIENPRCFEIEALGNHLDDHGIKGGCTKMRLVKEITLPSVTPTQRFAFAILCAQEVFDNKEWNQWANDWLSGKDRSANAAYAAYAAAYAAYAAYAAANAANAAYAAYAAANAAYAAYAAANAANAAANAANAAANAAKWDFKKLLSIAKKAMDYK